jgi:hypothetical protein
MAEEAVPPPGERRTALVTPVEFPRFAITGGTGDYIGARGEVEYVAQDNITFRFRSIMPIP